MAPPQARVVPVEGERVSGWLGRRLSRRDDVGMSDIATGLGPGPEADRLALAAERQRADLEAFLIDLHDATRVMLPDARCLVWRSAASESYEVRLRAMGDRLRAVTAAVTDAVDAHSRQASRLRTIADAPGAW